MSPSIQQFFTPEEKASITNAIQQAELNTSGEIRVHIESKCKGDVLDRAADVFHLLKMDKTELRNGVLFYLAVNSRHFAIIGDRGINAVVPENFWAEIKEMMAEHFKAGEFASGLSKGIEEAGKSLKQHFPYQTDDVNELSDDISFESNN
jgi:uncharacterized membrane protein